MISNPSIFYKTFQKDYHKIKAIYLKGILDNIQKYESDFFDEDYKDVDQNDFKIAIKSDLRQTYFHAIETFFELFLGLNPKGKKPYMDRNILFTLSNTNFTETYSKIRKISESNKGLDFLNEKTKYNDYEVTIGQYLFYTGIIKNDKLNNEFLNKINNSLEVIKIAIKILANDFVKREEYNAYKHGLRIIPATEKLAFADPDTLEIKLEMDLSDSMSFYAKTKDKEKLKVVTKVFDSERDYKMTILCSKLIHSILFYRRVSMRFESDKNKFEKIPVLFFDKDWVNDCSKINVEFQDFIHTITQID